MSAFSTIPCLSDMSGLRSEATSLEQRLDDMLGQSVYREAEFFEERRIEAKVSSIWRSKGAIT